MNIIGKRPIFNKKSEADQNHEFITCLENGEPFWKHKFDTTLFWGYVLKKYILDNNFIIETPYNRQILAICDHHRTSMLGGGLGGAKTSGLITMALMFVQEPNYKAAIIRNQLSSMRKADSIFSRTVNWLQMSPMRYGKDYRVNKQDSIISFPSTGSEIDFIHTGGETEQEKILNRYSSSQFSSLFFEELFEMPDGYAYSFLQTRLRKSIESDFPIRVRIGTNPPEISDKNKNYLVKDFIPPDEISTPFNALDIHAVYYNEKSFYPMSFHSNPYIDDEEYLLSLGDLSKNDKLRLIDGRWDISTFSTGLLFTQEDLDRIVVSEIPSEYDLIVIGIDTSGNLGSDDTTFCVLGIKNLNIYLIKSEVIPPIKNRYNTYDDESRKLTDIKLVERIKEVYKELGRLDFICRESPIKAEDARINSYFNELFGELLIDSKSQMLSIPPVISKYERLKQYAHLLKGKNIFWIYDDIDAFTDLCAQFIYITYDKKEMNRLPSPDLVDSISTAMNFIQTRILHGNRASTTLLNIQPNKRISRKKINYMKV